MVAFYDIAQRRQEIGVRKALGATGADVVRMILYEGLTPTAIGLVGGVLRRSADDQGNGKRAVRCDPARSRRVLRSATPALTRRMRCLPDPCPPRRSRGSVTCPESGMIR